MGFLTLFLVLSSGSLAVLHESNRATQTWPYHSHVLQFPGHNAFHSPSSHAALASNKMQAPTLFGSKDRLMSSPHDLMTSTTSTTSTSTQIAPPQRRDGPRARFAVVRPVWAGELPELATAMKLVDTEPSACKQKHSVDLVLYFDGGPADEVVNSTAAMVLDTLAGQAAPCFQSTRVEYGNVSGNLSYPFAPCAAFTGIFSQSKPAWGYKAFYQMELDVTPLRTGWLDDLMPLLEEAASGSSWVIGGTYDRGCMDQQRETEYDLEPLRTLSRGDARVDGHINGNAVYTSDPGFVSQVLKQRKRCFEDEPIPAMYDYHMFEELRTSPNPMKRSLIHSKWRQDALFKNCKPSSKDQRAGETIKFAAAIEKLFPSVLFLHGLRPGF